MRPWSLWPKKFREELSVVSGVTGVGGVIISVAGITAVAGSAALLVTGVGIVLAGGTFLYAGYKAIPQKFERPQSLVGKTLTIEQLDLIHPPIQKLAIIGPKNSGKTTLRTNLAFAPRTNSRTQFLTVQIVAIPVSPPKFLGVIDGAGERLNHQFDIAKEADFLCIILDHNISDKVATPSKERFKEIENLLEQVRNALADSNLPRKEWIEILINKEDLWEKATLKKQTEFDSFCQDELNKWKNSNLAKDVRMFSHSNERMNDINRFMEVLKLI